MAKIKDIIKYNNETSSSNPNGFNNDENTVNTSINEMKLLKGEINNKTQIQQKTIKSLLNTLNNNSANTNTTTTNNNNYYYKDSNIFRNIKTTINTNCNNLITVVSPTSTIPTTSTGIFNNNNSKFIKNSTIDATNKNLSILLNNEKHFNDYNCTSCNRSYNDKEKLKRHINNTHKKEKKFECNFCYKK